MSEHPRVDTTTMMRRRNLRVTEQLLGELAAWLSPEAVQFQYGNAAP